MQSVTLRSFSLTMLAAAQRQIVKLSRGCEQTAAEQERYMKGAVRSHGLTMPAVRAAFARDFWPQVRSTLRPTRRIF